MAGSNIFNHSELACRRAAKKLITSSMATPAKPITDVAKVVQLDKCPYPVVPSDSWYIRHQQINIEEYLTLTEAHFESVGKLFWHILDLTTAYKYNSEYILKLNCNVNRATTPVLNTMKAGDFTNTDILRSSDIYFSKTEDYADDTIYKGRQFMREYVAKCRKQLKELFPTPPESFSVSVFLFPRSDGIVFNYSKMSFKTIALLEFAERVARLPHSTAIELRAFQLFAWKCMDIFNMMQKCPGISIIEQEQAARFAVAWRAVAATVSLRTGRV